MCDMSIYLDMWLYSLFFFLIIPRHPRSTLFPYTTLFRSGLVQMIDEHAVCFRSPGGHFTRCLLYPVRPRSEEHTSELQSHSDLVCRLLLEKKKKHIIHMFLAVVSNSE